MFSTTPYFNVKFPKIFSQNITLSIVSIKITTFLKRRVYHIMIEVRHLKCFNLKTPRLTVVAIFIQTILSFVLSRKITNNSFNFSSNIFFNDLKTC